MGLVVFVIIFSYNNIFDKLTVAHQYHSLDEVTFQKIVPLL